jgi:hypothetical protein
MHSLTATDSTCVASADQDHITSLCHLIMVYTVPTDFKSSPKNDEWFNPDWFCSTEKIAFL